MLEYSNLSNQFSLNLNEDRQTGSYLWLSGFNHICIAYLSDNVCYIHCSMLNHQTSLMTVFELREELSYTFLIVKSPVLAILSLALKVTMFVAVTIQG